MVHPAGVTSRTSMGKMFICTAPYTAKAKLVSLASKKAGKRGEK